MFNVGVNPSDIAFKGNRAYVCNSNSYSIPNADSISVLDLTDNTVITNIFDPSFMGPYRIAIWHNSAYVCNSNSTTISVIDLDTNTVSHVIEGLNGPGGIVILGHFAYVTNYGVESGTGSDVRIVNLLDNSIVKIIETDLAPSAIKVSEDEKRLYVTCYADGNPNNGTLNILSVREQRVLRTITGFSGPFDLTVDMRYLYVTNFGSNNFAPFGTTVSVVDLKKFRIVNNIEIGIQPASITSDDKYVYVSTYNALYAGPNFTNLTYGLSSIVTIKKKSQKVIETKPVTFSVSSLKLHSDKLYLCHYAMNVVTFI